MDENTFLHKLAEKDITLTDKQINQFDQYYSLLVEWNKKMNLTSITEKESVYLKHFYDSITPRFYFPFEPDMKICDIGAGAGFPSLPMLITMPGMSVTIVESLKKRVTFLDELVSTLALDNVELIHGRAEDVGKDPHYRESFSVVTSRAVAKLSVLSEFCLPLCKVDGHFIALKGTNMEQELIDAKHAIKTFGGVIKENHHFQLPDNQGDRTIVCVEKVKNTPKKYPRKAGTPAKDPI